MIQPLVTDVDGELASSLSGVILLQTGIWTVVVLPDRLRSLAVERRGRKRIATRGFERMPCKGQGRARNLFALHPIKHRRGFLFALEIGIVGLLPVECLAADDARLDVGSLIETASGVGPVLCGILICFTVLVGANVANLLLAWRVIPRDAARIAASHVASGDLDGLASLSKTHRGIFTESLQACVKRGSAGQQQIDVSEAVTTFDVLSRVFFFSPNLLKAFSVIVLAITILGIGLQFVRLYVDLYERLAVVVGEYPFREVFQLGCARMIVFGIGGLLVFTMSVVTGYLFSGTLRLILMRQTSRFVGVISATQTSTRNAGPSEHKS